MNDSVNKIICIIGPTASGKTSLACDLSHILPGEMVNADSKQVYKGIDILPGKDIPHDAVFVQSDIAVNSDYTVGFYSFDEVRLWLLDIVTPQFSFSVYDFMHAAYPVIQYIRENNRIPILVGGSGFYIKALLDGIETLSIPRDETLRKEYQNKDVKTLQNILREYNEKQFESMNDSDKQNPRRLMRAIEISRAEQPQNSTPALDADILMIGLKTERDELKKRIDDRVTKRIEQGVLDEVTRLFENKAKLSDTVLSINGIRPLFDYYEGKITQDEAILQWKQSEYMNAKKQMTWFSKDERIVWFDIGGKNYKEKIFQMIDAWMNN